jgi:cytochrome c biogenesis protein
MGTVISSLVGFKAQEIIPKTEIFHIQNIVGSGQFTKIPKISNRINDFWITYSQNNSVNQFYSDISTLNDNGKEVARQTIYVNSPSKYNGVTYYQTDWNLLALRIKNELGQISQYPLIPLLNKQDKLWVSWIPLTSDLNQGLTVLINNLEGYLSVYNTEGTFLGNLELNEKNQSLKSFTLADIICATGLQIKVDPGINIVYTGFGLLMLSSVISYITYSQFWVVKNNNNMFIGGVTTRATFEFELEFSKLINKFKIKN